MRLKQSRVRKYYHKTKKIEKDKEGGTYEKYEPSSHFFGEVWCASGKIQTEMYGERVTYIRNVRMNGKYHISQDEKGVQHYTFLDGLDLVEGDGICLYVDGDSEPDYRIISVKPERFLRLEAEKIR